LKCQKEIQIPGCDFEISICNIQIAGWDFKFPPADLKIACPKVKTELET